VVDGDWQAAGVIVHDVTNRAIAHMLVEMPFGEFPMALGVIYDDPRRPSRNLAKCSGQDANRRRSREGKSTDLAKAARQGHGRPGRYAVQLLSPATGRWFHTDGLFIVSPWLLAFLGFGIWRARKGKSGRPAIVALLITLAFILVNMAISAMAWRAPTTDVPYAQPDRIFASPEPLLFWRRNVVWRAGGAITQGRFDPLRSAARLLDYGPQVADNMSLPVVKGAAMATPEVRDFLAWSQMPTARVDRDGCNVTVTFGDARFAGPVMAGGFQETVSLKEC
jgi:hypothetical protein